jgi:hypothetical protein
MPSLTIKRRHTQYEEWRDACNFLWKSYLGGRAYHESEDPIFLDKYPSEKGYEYTSRRDRAYLLNFLSATVDAYVAAVFRRDPVREPGEDGGGELSPGIQMFIEDATGNGVDLNKFSRDVATFALAAERAFVGVDVLSSGLPYAYLIHPSNIVDFSEALDGSLNWAIVAEEEVVDDDPFKDRETQQRYRLWLPTTWQLFDESGNQIDEGPNGAGRVPIISVPGSDVRLPIYDIALINKRIYNQCSQLDEIFYHVTFPMFYFSSGEGIEDDTGSVASTAGDTSPIDLGPARALELPAAKDLSVLPPGFLAPPDGPARVLMDERQMLIDAIRSLAGLERKDPDALAPQSGLAKAYDFRETNERFVSFAQIMEEFENELFLLIGDYGIAGQVNVTYNKDFQVRDFQMLTDTYDKVQFFLLPPEVKKRAALDYSMAIAEEATEDEKRDIRQAVENMTEFDTPIFLMPGVGTGIPTAGVPVSPASGASPQPRPSLSQLLGQQSANNQPQ